MEKVGGEGGKDENTNSRGANAASCEQPMSSLRPTIRLSAFSHHFPFKCRRWLTMRYTWMRLMMGKPAETIPRGRLKHLEFLISWPGFATLEFGLQMRLLESCFFSPPFVSATVNTLFNADDASPFKPPRALEKHVMLPLI